MFNIEKYLKECELFARLKPDAQLYMASRFREVVFEPGFVICKEGEIGDKMFIILQGEASVLKNMGWGNRELKRMGPGEVFGEMALITHEKRSATVKAVTRIHCLQISKEDFTDLLNQDSHFGQQVALIQSRRLRDSDDKTARELLESYQTLMFALANLADSRDPETGAHLNRTRNYCALLAEHLQDHRDYREDIYPGFVESIYHVSPLHDIGKVAVPDAILLKPGRLTNEEFETIKLHTIRGAETLQGVVDRSDLEVFRMACRICRHHHEKWDGTGYPDKLAGAAIPLEARIMALADVYDALLSKRVYKPPMSYAETRDEIRRSAGTFFDPVMTEIMLEYIGDFEKVHTKYQEP